MNAAAFSPYDDVLFTDSMLTKPVAPTGESWQAYAQRYLADLSKFNDYFGAFDPRFLPYAKKAGLVGLALTAADTALALQRGDAKGAIGNLTELVLGTVTGVAVGAVTTALALSPIVATAVGVAAVAGVVWGVGKLFDPLVIDLDQDGIELRPLQASEVLFDMRANGTLQATAWVGADDGILVQDMNGDGQINNLTELFSESHTPGISTGLGALADLDRNFDGVLDAQDAAYADVRVWRDLNQNGVADEGELATLAETGVVSIELNAQHVEEQDADGNVIRSRFTFTGDGVLNAGGEMAEAALMSAETGFTLLGASNGVNRYQSPDGTVFGIAENDAPLSLDLAPAGLNAVIGGAGADSFSAGGSAPVAMDGGAGADTLTGGDGADYLVGGGGADQLFGGAGDDVLVIDATTALVNGGAGRDTVIVSGTGGVVLDLAAAQIEEFYGGAGNDTITAAGSAEALYVTGGAGQDALSTGAGDDTLVGGLGDDTLAGGAGTDFAVYQGRQADYQITTNADGSITVVDTNTADGIDEGADTLTGIERLSFADGIIHTDGTNNAPAAGAVAFAERGAGALLMTAAQLLANSSDPDGDALRILAVGKAVNGTVMLTANGDVMFKPADGFVGQAGFEFTVSDGNGGQSRARASISCGLAEPTDTYYARQWHLQAINVVDVWDDYTGAGVLVGINDFGVDPNHPDYAGNYDTAKDWDYAHGDGDPTPQESTHNQNHGTAMAGLIGAQRNGQGMVGVAYGATLAGFWQNGRSYAGQQNVDVSANFSGPLGWATDSSGAKIRNPLNTIYSPDGIDAQQAAELNAAVTQGRAGLGTVVVNSAGNDQDFEEDSNSFYPFNARQTIAVGALDTTGKMAAFSLSGANVLVSAPGVNCLCTDRPGAAGYEDGTQTISDPAYYFGSGTCPAAGIVAGVAALMLEANPALGWRDVQEILAYSAWQSDAAASGLQTNGAKNWNGGGLVSGAQGGFGMVDARAAVRLAETWISQGTSANEASLTQSRSVALAIPDGGAGGVSDTCTVSTGLNIDHVEVAVNIGHANIGDLEIILTSPDGTKSVLLNRPEVDPTVPNSAGASEDGINWTFMSTRHWGETGAGQWTLTVKDLRSGNTGTLNNWSLKLYGDALSADDTYIYTVDYAGFTGDANAGRRLLTDSGGLDTINAAAVNAAALIDLHAGAAGRIAGNAFGIAAGSVIENAFSGDGDDTLIGNEAANWLRAGRGNDVLEGGLGADTLDGGSGDDTVSYEHSSASVAVNLANGTGLGGEAAGDVLLQVENLVGSHYGDALTGDSQANWLEGGVGSDTLSGGAGHDLLEGGEGADRLLGEEGDDTLFGAAGDDTLEGGAGTDTAVFRGYASEYTVTTVNGVTTVSGADGVDTLTGVELLRFADTERSVTPNGAPTATAASLSGAEDQGISLLVSDLLGLASDPDNDVLSFLGVESPSHGAVALTASGTVIFVPEKDYVGEAGFSYRVSDGRGGESSARVSITLGAVNDAPAAVLSVVALAAGQSVAGQLAATDADDTPSALRYTLQTSAGHGSVSLGEDGAYVYTANAGYAGADAFSYTVTDASGAAVVGQVAVQVAGPSRAGQTFQVNTASRQNIGTDIETSIALAPSVAALSGGRFVVAWAAADADGYGVWCNVFDAGGNPLGQERRVNTWTEKDQSHVSVSSLSGGGYVVAWASEGQNGPYTSIQAQRFDDAGVPQGGEFRVNASAQSENLMPVVTGMADGGFMIAWSGYQADGDNWGACARRFDASGIAQGGDILLNTTSQDIQSMPQIASLAGGHFVAVWQSNLQDGSSTGVYAQIFDSKGGKIGGELQINTWTDDYQGAPQVVTLAGGGFVVAWTSYFEDMSYHGIYARRFGEDGSPLGPEFIVNEDDRAGSQLYPRLAALPDGGFAVSWASYNNALVNQRSFLADGTPTSSFVTRGSFNGTEYAAPTLAALDNGETVVVWQTAATQTAPTELRAQISGQYGSSFASMYLSGSDGNDTLQGAEAADILRGRQGRDMLSGGAGDDILDGGAGADTLSGGAGEDTASYKYSGQAVQVNLLSGLAQGGDAEGDSLQSIENVQGSGFGDTLTGDAGANRLEGGAGADSLYGGAGDDTLVIDRADLDSGILDGGEGLDTLRVVEDGGGYVLKLAGRGIEQAFGSNGADTIIGDGQHNGLHGGAGADVLSGAGGNDTLDGGAGNDALSGDDGADVLTGGEGMDYLSGGEGADSLSGGAGDDVLLGGAGNDTLRGDGGWDILAGGAGSDTLEGCNAGETYHFNAGDGDDTLRSNGVLGSFSFGPGISMEDLHCAGSGDDLTI
ncbi:MAG TPA: cadherin-like domain-containing protein, partial [Humidesulfovibrio sp.]|uniref:cadherin-like domain-containing protein n=1 Tax=Humidesulfovibrio sp. TaxID=2910988 RepID=UPI002B615161